MEDTQIIALYLSRQEAAIGETAKKYGGYTRSDELGLPVRDTGLALPCGATCRWTKEKP